MACVCARRALRWRFARVDPTLIQGSRSLMSAVITSRLAVWRTDGHRSTFGRGARGDLAPGGDRATPSSAGRRDKGTLAGQASAHDGAASARCAADCESEGSGSTTGIPGRVPRAVPRASRIAGGAPSATPRATWLAGCGSDPRPPRRGGRGPQRKRELRECAAVAAGQRRVDELVARDLRPDLIHAARAVESRHVNVAQKLEVAHRVAAVVGRDLPRDAHHVVRGGLVLQLGVLVGELRRSRNHRVLVLRLLGLRLLQSRILGRARLLETRLGLLRDDLTQARCRLLQRWVVQIQLAAALALVKALVRHSLTPCPVVCPDVGTARGDFGAGARPEGSKIKPSADSDRNRCAADDDER
jgi:hypothetical protein